MERPRFFIASEHSDDPPAPSEPAFVLDSFVHVASGKAVEVLTGLDALGSLGLWPLDARDERLSSLQAHLTHAEVATPARRKIESATDGLWLFALELVEQLPDAPGANDPVYLYGTLWPADDPSAPGQSGQLTSTRGDVLRGLVEALRWAFLYPPDPNERTPRAFHLMLPGDRADAIAAGRGLVLVYPAMDPGLLLEHAGNELQILQIFHDLLAALYKDADRVRPRHPDDNPEPLPVPDRQAFLDDLEGHGWELDAASGSATQRGDDGGFFKSLFGSKTRIKLPAQATIEDYTRRARAELARLASWPSPASEALFARVAPWTGTIASPRAPMPTPTAPKAPAPPASASPTAGPRRAAQGDWMKDFVAAHTPERPQLTPVRPAAPARTDAPRRSGRPDWMKDFD